MFSIIERNYGLIIDDYEEETIPADCIDGCIEIVRSKCKDGGKTFIIALQYALKRNMPLTLEF